MTSKRDVIAFMSLELRHDDGTSSPVVVRIGRPRRDAVDYRCDYGTLEVARRPNALGVGTSYPFGTVVGQEQAHALVHLCREQGTPIL